ncbi:type VI secretion-associated protein [Klebsiella pneumoniae]|nr:type VI secretion-associated protein [Klebsiella pneumoniae]
MSILQNLVAASQLDESVLRQQARSRQAQWQSWLAPISDAQPTGDDPGYDDDFSVSARRSIRSPVSIPN